MPTKKAAASRVPETTVKKLKSQDRSNAQRAQDNIKAKKANKAKRQDIFKRAEKYVKEYRQIDASAKRMSRIARNAGNFYVPQEATLAFVIRIRGINGVDPKTRKILQLLRLNQIHKGVFVKVNKASINMLQRVLPYIAYGYPNLKSVRELIYKRGFAKVQKQRIPITDNSVIENALVEKTKGRIICIEDIIHTIYTIGEDFSVVNNFLWPFKLSSPKGGFKQITRMYADGGDAGNREELINGLIRQMN